MLPPKKGAVTATGRSRLASALRTNPRKPGAALAAAAAASRLDPTPHAAAIRLKRAVSVGSLDGVSTIGLERSNSEETASGGISESDTGDGGLIQGSRLSDVVDDELFGKVHFYGDDVGVIDPQEIGFETKKASNLDGSGEEIVAKLNDNLSLPSIQVYTSNSPSSQLEDDGGNGVRMVDAKEVSVNDQSSDNGVQMLDAKEVSVNDQNSYNGVQMLDAKEVSVNDQHSYNGVQMLDTKKVSGDDQNSDYCVQVIDAKEVHVNDQRSGHDVLLLDAEEVSANGQISDHGVQMLDAEEGSTNDQSSDHDAQMLDEKAARMADKILQDSMKPLEWAEEVEKRQVSHGIHWEEGAVAQTMRFEGIRKAQPAVGCLHIDPDNMITRLISSQMFRHEYGSPQVVAAHMSFIAVGMSKGVVLAVPSKYSPYTADIMDSKVLFKKKAMHHLI